MAIQLIGAKWNYDISGSEKRYLVDSASEVGGLPEAPPDSRALVLDTGAAYIVNASGKWVETVIPAGGTGGGGGSDITVISGTVSLDFSEGNMIVSPGTGKAYSSVLIPKPAALIPENIVDGVEIAGVEGTNESGLYTIVEDVPVILNLSEGDQTISVPGGYAVKTAIIQKPEGLTPENIVKGVEIAGVVGTHEGSGGGTVAGAATVTFMNGDAVYYTRPEIIGDDCPNPVTQGRVDAPTKESTAQYDYTYSGWSLTDGGTADTTNALKNITEDRTVYAAYTSAVRYYTITYYDSDGTTVLKTESLPYGAEITYAPEKGDEMLDKWVPDAVPVEGDASYTAAWKAKPAFETASWDEIAAICDAGLASSTFAVGDEREETITYEDGTSETVVWQIADFGNRTTYINGEDKQANMVVVSKHALTTPQIWAGGTGSSYRQKDYKGSGIHAFLTTTFFNALDPSLQSAIKPALFINETGFTRPTSVACWSLNAYMVHLGESNPGAVYYRESVSGAPPETRELALFSSESNRIKTLIADGSAVDYWLCSHTDTNFSSWSAHYVSASGELEKATINVNKKYIVPCFCI